MVSDNENTCNKENQCRIQLEEAIIQRIEQQALLALPIDDLLEKETLTNQEYSRVNNTFPVTTVELAVAFNLPVSTTFDLLARLRRRKRIRSRKYQWFNKVIYFYIPYEMKWPYYLFRTCGGCENWNRFTHSCTFYQELADESYAVDELRLHLKITSNLVACKWIISRIARALHTFPSLQTFAEKTVDRTLWWQQEELDEMFITRVSVPQPCYRCYQCSRVMPELGWGMLPLVGSSLRTCRYCGSYYKLISKKETSEYTVTVSKEKTHEYARRFALYTGGDVPEGTYNHSEYGISLIDLNGETDLNDEIDVLTNYNLYAFYPALSYLVVKTKEEQELLEERVKKDHPKINILLADEPLKSVQPTKQQQGVAILLKESGVLIPAYSRELVWSRLQVLEDLEEFVKQRTVLTNREKLLGIIQELVIMEKRKGKLTSDEWNRLDGRAAKIIWEVVKGIVEPHGFELPNRSSARHLEGSRIKPYGLYHSYSKANTVFNGTFRKTMNIYIEKCNKHKFPWEGLEGICHKKTTHGVYDLLLDNNEGNKQVAIPQTVRAIVEGRVLPEMIEANRLRKRIKVYYLERGKAGEKWLEEEIKELAGTKVVTHILGKEKKATFEAAIENQVVGVKRLFDDIVWLDETILTVHGKKYTPWAIGAENRWEQLSPKQQTTITDALKGVLVEAKSYFKPFRYQKELTEEAIDLKKL